jgi:hypothetical protein
MLNDITYLTNFVFSKFIPNNKEIYSAKSAHSVCLALEKVISAIHVLEVHYLALTFNEGYLQDSSIGKPVDKWRKYINKDLTSLNKKVTVYLQALNNLTSMSEEYDGSYLSSLYNYKIFYSFVRDRYNVGIIEPCSCTLMSTTLLTDIDSTAYHITEYKKISLSSYEERLTLQSLLKERAIFLSQSHKELQQYLIKNYTIEDLI